MSSTNWCLQDVYILFMTFYLVLSTGYYLKETPEPAQPTANTNLWNSKVVISISLYDKWVGEMDHKKLTDNSGEIRLISSECLSNPRNKKVSDYVKPCELHSADINCTFFQYHSIYASNSNWNWYLKHLVKWKIEHLEQTFFAFICHILEMIWIMAQY